MDYKEYNDLELLDYIHSCNEDANEILLYKYRPLTISLAKKLIKYCYGGVDLNDLIQEGLLALNDAINSYRDDKEASFATYAKICIERKMYSIVKSTRTYKNKFLNESISIEDDEDNTIDKFLVDNSNNPENVIEDFDNEKILITKLDKQLTDFEKQVFELKRNYFNYKEIAEILDKDPKSIDNAIQRIKVKLKKTIEETK